jgi:hypothetical protein
MRQSSLVTYALPVRSLVVISPHSPRAADGFCDEIADYILAGVGNAPIQGKRDTFIDVLAGRSSGYIRLNDESAENAASALRNLHTTPELMAALKARFGDEFEDQFPDATIAWLQDDVRAVQALFGHTGCTVMVFFDASDGHAREVPPPAGMSFGMTDLCGTPTRIGTIKSVPAVIEEEDSADLIEARITIVPWQHRQWGQICHISAAFSAALAKNFGNSRAFCRPEVDCPKLYRKMHDVAEDHLSQIHDEVGKMSESL